MNLDDEIVLGIRLSTLVLSAAALVTAAVAHLWIRWWLRRRSRHADVELPVPGAAPGVHMRWWISRGVRALLPPLGLLVWIHGVYAVLTMLLGDTSAASVAVRVWGVVEWCYRALMLVTAFWLLRRIGAVVEVFLRALADRSENTWDNAVLPLAGQAARTLLPLLALILAAPVLAVSPALETMFRNGVSLIVIGVIAFVLIKTVEASAAMVLRRHRIDVADNLRARAVSTQVMVLRRVAMAVIVIFALASMLMVFESVRQFGASILASAGIAGIIVGLAAQRSIAALLAGFQIAITQPIRVDDVVIVENEWGRIEEITLTYVVVRIWDLRRLVLPITYFIEQPFQNWTRQSADILATVFLHVDYTVPIGALRAELTRILDASPHWDRKVNVLQVTDAKERTLEVRALASAVDASTAWDLRCEVREKLVDFLQRHHPESLPKLRGVVHATTGAA